MNQREISTSSLRRRGGIRTVSERWGAGLDIRFLFAYDINMPDDEKQRGALLMALSSSLRH